MEEKNEQSVRDIFRQILEKDKSLLNSRDELSAKLEKEVPAALTRNMKPIQTALQKNIGEMFLTTAVDDSEKQAEVCQKAAEILQQDGMLQKRAHDVVDAFAYAFGWQDEPESLAKTTSLSEAATDEQQADTEAVQEPVPAGTGSWTCVCGTENTGKFCVSCGAARDSLVNLAKAAPGIWTCSCGTQNTEKLCVACGKPKGGQADMDQTMAVAQPPIQPAAPAASAPLSMRTQLTADGYQQPQQPTYSAPPSDSKAKTLLITVIVILAATVLFFVVRGFVSPSSDAHGSSSVKQTTDKKASAVDSDLSLGGVSLGYSVDKLHEVLGTEKEQKKGDYGTTVYIYDAMKVGVKDGRVVGLTSDGVEVKTKRDMHEGSSIDDVFSVYGKDYTTSEYDGKKLYEYTFTTAGGEQGILRFAVEKTSNKVNYISIRLLLKDNTPTATQTPADIAGARSRFLSYHQAISNHNLQAAYNILSSRMQNQMGEYSSYSSGYRTTLSSNVTNLQVTSSDSNHVQLTYDLKARDRAGNRVKVQNFAGSANMVLVNGTWNIDSMSANKQGEYFE